MNHLKGYNEAFLDYFRKDTDDDKIILQFIHRLEKVKDINPYEIRKVDDTSSDLPNWMSLVKTTKRETEYFSHIYVVKFEDVDILITNDRHDLINNQTQEITGYKKCDYPWRMFLGSDISGIGERIDGKDLYRERLFNLVDKIYKNDIKLNRLKRIKSEINPSADLIDEGIFDFFSKKETEDDKIALKYINRLKKVKDTNPYEIKKFQSETNSYRMYRWEVYFEDTPIHVWDIKANYGFLSTFYDESRNFLIDQGLAKYNNYEFYGLKAKCDDGELEKVKANSKLLKELAKLIKSIYEKEENIKRIKNIKNNINDIADLIDESMREREVLFTSKRNRSLIINVKKTPDGRITSIENETGIRFPFSVGQILNRNAEVWACNNNFLMDGKDTCPEKKIFGIKSSDVPKGHEWRHIFPNKF